jgi:F-type H+-transporting ATPase subunit alpha
VKDDVISVEGVIKGGMSEIVEFEEINLKGIINYLDKNKKAGISVLGNANKVKVGSRVKVLGKLPTVKVGYGLLGRVVNALGEAIDSDKEIKDVDEILIEKIAPGIITRQPVNEPVETGVKFIDSMIPVGCGQRELIIGDPKTGKTAIAIDTIINQKGKEKICIYVAIGQKQTSVAKVHNLLKKRGCMQNTIIVSATAAEPAVMQYLAPFAGCAIGEYFMNKFRKVIVIYDDLSKHAVAYRQMSLLLRRPPGREGYPGDVFYLHSRLLERAARLKNKILSNNIIRGGGSLTALPIIETISGDVSAYIPTNVISITDGQIFLETELFYQGIRPAISPGISVSRVGSLAQNVVIKKLAGPLKLDLAQYRELYQFAQLGMPLDSTSKFILEKGARLQKLMVQPAKSPVSMVSQIMLLFGGINEMLNDINISSLFIFERQIEFTLIQKILKNFLILYYHKKYLLN